MLNTVIIIGKIQRPPKLFKTKSGEDVARFNVACERDFKSSKGNIVTDYIPVSLYGKDAKTITEYGEGHTVVVTGRIKVAKNKEKGTYFTEVVSMKAKVLCDGEEAAVQELDTQ